MIAHTALNRTTRFEPLLGMLQGNIREMNGPDNPIYTSGQGNEKRRLGKFLDRPLNHLSHSDVRNLQEFLFKD